MFSFNSCLFTFNGNDKYGKLFSHQLDEKKKFYIKSKYSVEPDFSSDTSIRMLTSYMSEDLDYSTELASINTNSTLSDDYLVKNILLDSLDYWASNFTRGGNCKGVEIQINLKIPTIIKTISIYWVKPPFSVTLTFCEEKGNCKTKETITEFTNLRTRVASVYLRSKFIKIQMGFDQSKLTDYNYQCFCSISKVSITKNEINLKPLSIDEAKKTPEELSLYDNRDLFTDNFLLSKINNFNKEDNILEKLFDESTRDITKIKAIKSNLKKTYIGQYSSFNILTEKLKKLAEKNRKAIVEKAGMFYELDEKLSNYISFEDYEKDHKSTSKDENNKKKFKEYKSTMGKLWSLRAFIKSFAKIKGTLKDLYTKSMKNIAKMRVSLNNYLNEVAVHFSESYSDQYIRDAIYTTNKIKQISSSVEIFDRLVPLKESFPVLESAFESMKQFTIPEMIEKLDYLSEKYQSVLT